MMSNQREYISDLELLHVRRVNALEADNLLLKEEARKQQEYLSTLEKDAKHMRDENSELKEEAIKQQEYLSTLERDAKRMSTENSELKEAAIKQQEYLLTLEILM